MPDDDLIQLITTEPLSDEIKHRLRLLAPAIKERANLITDLPAMAGFAMINTPPPIEDDAIPLLNADMLERLQRLANDYPDGLADIEAVKTWFSEWLAVKELKMRDIGPGLRVALTGTRQAPDIGLLLTVLGQEQVVLRLNTVCQNPI
jgi:glutamyl/glutaminyl-tRNA synthetase